MLDGLYLFFEGIANIFGVISDGHFVAADNSFNWVDLLDVPFSFVSSIVNAFDWIKYLFELLGNMVG